MLLYHRVADDRPDRLGLNVSPRHFAEHMEVLRSSFQPLSLREVARGIEDGCFPQRGIAITFDDGYSSLVSEVKPILELSEIPATAFLVSDTVGADREFWWDELEAIIMQPPALPRSLHLESPGQSYHWQTGRPWRRLPKGRFHVRRASTREDLYFRLSKFLMRHTGALRRQLLDQVAAWAGWTRPPGRRGRMGLTHAELLSLDGGSLVEIGGHSATHSLLAALDPLQQKEEIAGGRTILENLLGHPVTSFAYPYGGPADYTPDSVAAVRDSGFQRACANSPGLIASGTDPFQLPRLIVGDWGGDRFEGWLNGWFYQKVMVPAR